MDGTLIIDSIPLDAVRVEDLSDENTEGHFVAGKIPALVEHGVNPEKSVYALAV